MRFAVVVDICWTCMGLLQWYDNDAVRDQCDSSKRVLNHVAHWLLVSRLNNCVA